VDSQKWEVMFTQFVSRTRIAFIYGSREEYNLVRRH